MRTAGDETVCELLAFPVASSVAQVAAGQPLGEFPCHLQLQLLELKATRQAHAHTTQNEATSIRGNVPWRRR